MNQFTQEEQECYQSDGVAKPLGSKKKVYMICALFLLVAVTVVFFIMDKKGKEANSEEGVKADSVDITSMGDVSEESTEMISEELKSAVVRIEVSISNISDSEETLQGSGVIIKVAENYIDIVTASHLVEQTASPLVYFYDGSLAYGSVLAYGKESDVAFVRVRADALEEGIGHTLKSAVYADYDMYESLQKSEEVFLIGSVTKVAGNVETGTIKEKEQFVELFQNNMLICEAEVINGMSGGGTFTDDGVLIGIIVGTNGSEAVSVAFTDVLAEYDNISL